MKAEEIVMPQGTMVFVLFETGRSKHHSFMHVDGDDFTTKECFDWINNKRDEIEKSSNGQAVMCAFNVVYPQSGIAIPLTSSELPINL